MTGKRVIAELTSLADCQLGPAHRIAEQTPLTGKEHALLKKVGLHSMLKDRFAALGMCHHEANARLRGETAPRLTENFLATSYKTRGKKERQAAGRTFSEFSKGSKRQAAEPAFRGSSS